LCVRENVYLFIIGRRRLDTYLKVRSAAVGRRVQTRSVCL